jgi:hypothetical protein
MKVLVLGTLVLLAGCVSGRSYEYPPLMRLGWESASVSEMKKLWDAHRTVWNCLFTAEGTIAGVTKIRFKVFPAMTFAWR